MKIFGFILIIAGIAMLFSTSFSFTTKENVVDAGPIQINANKKREVTWPSYAGGVIIAAGVVLVAVSKKK
ncbi:hypothetical protein [Algoriphagus pacificus]|uniref:DUF3185 domain-containing protein n=1 Tax=Algoriphagus pacificus TaxID=2811234 RepID=A0ABS3CIV3_9BACT|nr:hypothetical protein [Algoriphagus pacificus]MBN7816416.1 hypothetical protein [Algoriphagus pacificus]